MQLTEFEDIRPYNDSEAPQKIQLLLADPKFNEVLEFLFKDAHKINSFRNSLTKVNTIDQIQRSVATPLVEQIIQSTTNGLTCSGLKNLDKHKSHLFISNHRDIILDSVFLNYMIIKNGMNTTQIAIGDNLLIYDWICHTVKLNRAFVVKRNISSRELLEASKKLSAYIRRSLTENNISVWIAQREGRTKNGNDQTQIALLKMLNMSNNKSLAEGFKELAIIPLSISYEIEPCGISKVSELIQRDTDGFQKTSVDDLKSMALGMFNPKGRVHYSFGKPILASFLEANNHLPTNKFIQELGIRIDHHLHQNFRLWPNNYIAYEMLNGTGGFTDKYTSQEVIEFKKLLSDAEENISQNPEEVAYRFLKMYATPVENSLIATDVFRL
ncbi:MAG: 1-acyl-sn-glycerol-3-phosphate acyltransferase [Bacteroidales bacterium]|nr:1-acyl-sn-glycerol-3-phosphate acyltransferase [Bacteroidales bacterium]MDZ4204049.1 1-acyl-sn-glycerol-3-phosphate acyltransferase [Bacteroidales bacterium]